MKKFWLSIGCLLLCAGLLLPLLISCSTDDGKDAQTVETTANDLTTTKTSEPDSKPEPKITKIYTAEQFLMLADLINEQGTGEMTEGVIYQLVTDIDLNEGWDATVTADGEAVQELPDTPKTVWPGITKFCGTLDGNGNKITGIFMSEDAADHATVGFIRELSGTIRNLTIENSFVTVNADETAENVIVGGLVGKISGPSVIENVTVDADMLVLGNDNAVVSGKFGYDKENNLTETNFLFAGNLYRAVAAPVEKAIAEFSESDPNGTVYTIGTAEELNTFAEKVGTSSGKGSGYVFKLTADIDLNPGWNAKPAINTNTKTVVFPNAPANSWQALNFAGTFDGQGHSISGLYRDTEIGEWGDRGLFFNWLTDNATVRNLVLVNGLLFGHQPGNNKANRILGGLASYANGNNITIENVYVDVHVWDSGYSAVKMGGLIGRINDGKTGLVIRNAVFAGTVGNIPAKGETSYPSTSTGTQAGQLVGDANTRPATCTNIVLAGSIYTADKTWDNVGKGGGLNTKANIVIGRFESVNEANAAWGIINYDKETVSMIYSEKAGMIVPASIADSLIHLEILPEPETPTVPDPVEKSITEFSESDPAGTIYTIGTAEELNTFAEKVGMSSGKGSGYVFKLTVDIDLNPGWDAKPTIYTGTNEVTFPEAPANSWKSFNFAGTFDGQGHSISGLYRDTEIGEWGDNGLFFRWLTDNAVVRNLSLVNGFFFGHQPNNATSNRIIGGLASYVNGNNVLIENVYVDLNVWDSGYNAVRIGGVIGRINDGKTGLEIRNTVFAGTVGTVPTKDAASYPSTSTGTQAGQLIGDANKMTSTCVNLVLAGSIYTADKTWDNIAKNNGSTSKVLENIVIGKFESVDEAKTADRITGYNAGTIAMTYSDTAGMILPVSVAEFFAGGQAS